MPRLSTADAAKRLGVAPRTLYGLIDEGRLAAFREGRKIYVDRDELDRFAEGFDGGDAHDREPRDPVRPRGAGSIALDPPP
jgi:excisionase family DNA binding protein